MGTRQHTSSLRSVREWQDSQSRPTPGLRAISTSRSKDPSNQIEDHDAGWKCQPTSCAVKREEQYKRLLWRRTDEEADADQHQQHRCAYGNQEVQPVAPCEETQHPVSVLPGRGQPSCSRAVAENPTLARHQVAEHVPAEGSSEDDEDLPRVSNVDLLVEDDTRSLAEVGDGEAMNADLSSGTPLSRPVASEPGDHLAVERYVEPAGGSRAEPPPRPPPTNADVPVRPRAQHVRLLAQ